MKTYTEQEINAALTNLNGWTYNGTNIVKTTKTTNFAAAIGFINAVAILAETADHHPDILLHGWNNVDILLSTHSDNGITKNDFDLAEKINALGY